MKTLFLIVDPQNDFVDPSGSLYVSGAVKDMGTIGFLLEKYGGKFDDVMITLDLHQRMDIGHPGFWMDNEQKHPSPFTKISYDDLLKGVWTTASTDHFDNAEIYLRALDNAGYKHTVWPEHCLIGEWGSNIYNLIADYVKAWSKKYNKIVNYIPKGLFPFSEFHGALGPFVEFPIIGGDAVFNFDLQNQILSYDKIIVTGEAKSHCVGELLHQLLQNRELDIAKKFIIVEDCMSNISGYEHKVFDTLRENGSLFTKSTTIFDEK